MSPIGNAEKELSENLFALCLQADALFEQQMIDNLQAAGIPAQWDANRVDHQELIIFYLWLARRIFSERPKVLNALQVAYYLVSAKTPFNGQDDQKVFQTISQRYFELDQAMSSAAQPLDVVYVSGNVMRRVFDKCPDLLPHLPKLEMIAARLFTEWTVSVTSTMKELM
jgi:hypothetical protein